MLGANGKARSVVVAPAARPSEVELARQRLLDKPAPAFSLSRVTEVDAKPAQDSLLLHRGHPVLVDFWATWCGPCVRAMPELGALRKRYAPRGLTVIGISTEDPELLRAAMKKYDIGHTILVDSKESVSRDYAVMALPTLVLIDSAGIVRDVEVGGDIEAIEHKLREIFIGEHLR